MTLPRLCVCGQPIQFSNEDRCEDCFAADSERYDGRSRHVDTPIFSAKEEQAHNRRSNEIKTILKGGCSNVRVLQTAPRLRGDSSR